MGGAVVAKQIGAEQGGRPDGKVAVDGVLGGKDRVGEVLLGEGFLDGAEEGSVQAGADMAVPVGGKSADLFDLGAERVAA